MNQEFELLPFAAHQHSGAAPAIGAEWEAERGGRAMRAPPRSVARAAPRPGPRPPPRKRWPWPYYGAGWPYGVIEQPYPVFFPEPEPRPLCAGGPAGQAGNIMHKRDCHCAACRTGAFEVLPFRWRQWAGAGTSARPLAAAGETALQAEGGRWRRRRQSRLAAQDDRA